MEIELVIGGYGAGLTPLFYDPAVDNWRLGEATRGTQAASFGVSDAKRGLHHFVDEAQGRVRSLRRTDEGWAVVASIESGGGAPCFVELDPTGRALAVANYETGSIGLCHLADGVVGSDLLVQAHVGNGPRKQRQDGPHAHCVRFRDGWLYSVDLGSELIKLAGAWRR